MLRWEELKGFLGCGKAESKFISLPQIIGVLPNISSDILGEVTYYSFFDEGILLLVDEGNVTQISLFLKPSEGFSSYTNELPVHSDMENDIINELGMPIKSGGGRPDPLLGYLNRWIKYKINEGYMHIEFNQEGKIDKLSLMKE